MVMIGKVRRMRHRQKKSVREIARITSLARNTVRKWLRAPMQVEPKYRRGSQPRKLSDSKAQPHQEFTHCSEPQPNTKFLPDQLRNHRPYPQTEVQTILARIAPIDPPEHLPLLCRGQAAWASRRLRRTQRLDAHTRLQRSLEPLVDRRAIEPVGRDHFRGGFTFPNSLDSHQPNRLQRLMIKRPPVSFHAL